TFSSAVKMQLFAVLFPRLFFVARKHKISTLKQPDYPQGGFMRTKWFLSALAFLLAIPVFAEEKEKKETARLEESAVVLHEIRDIPESIPKALLDTALFVEV